VLDVGCSIGTLGSQIKKRYKTVEVIGIEIDKKMAEVAKKRLDKVLVEDVEKINLEDYFEREYFDCIIFADVLEHLVDPWSVLKKATYFLDKNGIIIASIPNIRYYDTILNLVFRGYWPYRERGIHDKTHLRQFTLKNIKEMFEYSKLKITRIDRKYRLVEWPSPYNQFSKFLRICPICDFFTFQYLIVAKK